MIYPNLIGIIRKVGFGHPLGVWASIKSARMLIKQFSPDKMRRNARQFIIAVGGIPIKEEIIIGIFAGRFPANQYEKSGRKFSILKNGFGVNFA